MKLGKFKKIEASLKDVEFKELPLDFLKDLSKKTKDAIKFQEAKKKKAEEKAEAEKKKTKPAKKPDEKK